MKKKLIALAAACLLGGSAAAEGLTPVFESVFDAGVYTSIDYDYIEEYAAETFDGWQGMCTSAAKTLDDGSLIVGRNLDMAISPVPAYIFRTRVQGCYETITLSYNCAGGPDCEQAASQGLDEEYRRVLPFFSPDILNSEGLFIEMNMRATEPDETGADRFGTPGTNPDSETRVSELALTRYVAEHCANIEEALEYVKTLDIYTMNRGGYQWALSYMMADATGRFGVLEIACNQIVWLEGENLHTNFYLHPDFARHQTLKIGLGRYDYVKQRLADVSSREDMAALMAQVSCFKSYFPETCPYDPRTELVGEHPGWTSEYVTDETHAREIADALAEKERLVTSMTRAELCESMQFVEAVFTEVVDCTNKTITVRFFEDDARTLTLSFDNPSEN